MVPPWSLLILIVFVTSTAMSAVEEEFIADYLDVFDNISPTFLIRTDLLQFAEFGVFLNKSLYSSM